MSDSMYAIGWLEMKEFDKAYADFRQMFRHVAGAFQVTDCMQYSLQCFDAVGWAAGRASGL